MFVSNPVGEVQPPTAMVPPSGDSATAYALPRSPSPLGSQITRCSVPSGSDQTRTVLSSEAVTAKRSAASVAMRWSSAIWLGALIRSIGSDGRSSACACRGAAPMASVNVTASQIHRRSPAAIMLTSSIPRFGARSANERQRR